MKSLRAIVLMGLWCLPLACVEDDPDRTLGEGESDDAGEADGDESADSDEGKLDDPNGGTTSVCTAGLYWLDCHAQSTTFVVDGEEREVLWQVPNGEPPPEGWPVVLAFHGTNDPAGKFFDWNYWNTIDNLFGGYYQLKTVQGLLDHGFAVIAPKALVRAGGIYWDTNIPPYDTDWESAPDAELMERLFDEIAAGTLGPLDPGRQYAMGLSSGGYMASRLAVDYPDQMKAVALQSASYAACISTLCSVSAEDIPEDHSPTLLMAGYWDGIVPLYTIEGYEDALVEAGVDVELKVVNNASHQWTSHSPGWVLAWFQTH
ncbi:dienelactone hydrolase family protein [Paraliomyxa miuraensis]|uniref:dienelactone hydrolase family protein n=1 Tax=Paraliomyxa miuraensis TaxID=376150 RepID=UPI0022526696|nr:dienelactone hydrolase family protein [Paraliomyxa miuraensis]MCX4241704.1 dienelactone hydrolase family protein [Paraliomyxa miuraensis]